MTVWTEKLKTYQKEHNCSYKEAMIKCSSGLTKKRPKTIKDKKSPKKKSHQIRGKFEIELGYAPHSGFKGEGLGLGSAEQSASLQKLLAEHGNATVI